MTELTETAGELTRAHTRRTVTDTGEVIFGEEPALLEILADCVTNPSSNGGAGGDSTRAGLPINADALVLWDRITGVIDACWPGNGDPAYKRVPATIKLNQWVNRTTDPVAVGVLLDLCRQWVAQVRELLEPTRRRTIPDVACPICGWDRTATQDEDGHWTYRPALVAFPDAAPMRVECTVESCSGEWSGPEVADTFMGALVSGSDSR